MEDEVCSLIRCARGQQGACGTRPQLAVCFTWWEPLCNPSAVSYLLYLSTNIYINYFHLMIGTGNALTVEWTVDCVKKNKHPTNCSNFMGNSLFVIFNSAIILIINSKQLGIIKDISPTATSENVVHFKLQPNNCTGEIFLWENAVSFLAS